MDASLLKHLGIAKNSAPSRVSIYELSGKELCIWEIDILEESVVRGDIRDLQKPMKNLSTVIIRRKDHGNPNSELRNSTIQFGSVESADRFITTAKSTQQRFLGFTTKVYRETTEAKCPEDSSADAPVVTDGPKEHSDAVQTSPISVVASTKRDSEKTAPAGESKASVAPAGGVTTKEMDVGASVNAAVSTPRRKSAEDTMGGPAGDMDNKTQDTLSDDASLPAPLSVPITTQLHPPSILIDFESEESGSPEKKDTRKPYCNADLEGLQYHSSGSESAETPPASKELGAVDGGVARTVVAGEAAEHLSTIQEDVVLEQDKTQEDTKSPSPEKEKAYQLQTSEATQKEAKAIQTKEALLDIEAVEKVQAGEDMSQASLAVVQAIADADYDYLVSISDKLVQLFDGAKYFRGIPIIKFATLQTSLVHLMDIPEFVELDLDEQRKALAVVYTNALYFHSSFVRSSADILRSRPERSPCPIEVQEFNDQYGVQAPTSRRPFPSIAPRSFRGSTPQPERSVTRQVPHINSQRSPPKPRPNGTRQAPTTELPKPPPVDTRQEVRDMSNGEQSYVLPIPLPKCDPKILDANKARYKASSLEREKQSGKPAENGKPDQGEKQEDSTASNQGEKHEDSTASNWSGIGFSARNLGDHSSAALEDDTNHQPPEPLVTSQPAARSGPVQSFDDWSPWDELIDSTTMAAGSSDEVAQENTDAHSVETSRGYTVGGMQDTVSHSRAPPNGSVISEAATSTTLVGSTSTVVGGAHDPVNNQDAWSSGNPLYTPRGPNPTLSGPQRGWALRESGHAAGHSRTDTKGTNESLGSLTQHFASMKLRSERSSS
ncbi:hypothetical protein F4778DRAFT_778357 [Xylariomycetidae sp. FL2044]|nr:hypothetical protein F4778DRAFT_778357 [Xylariomycetidae sp. FL2044]